MTQSSIKLDDLRKQGMIIPTNFRDDTYSLTQHVQTPELKLPTADELERRITQATEQLLIDPSIVRQMYYALASGKHVILYGPPGTGKTTLAREVARHVFEVETSIRTASADWTTFDTIGGIRVRSTEEGFEAFEPSDGCITEAILNCCNCIMADNTTGGKAQASWLILDELNRAKIDYILGDMFTAMDEGTCIALDYYRGSSKPENTVLYIPRRFRIIGTMNTYDKNYLFRLSYALIRRFAFVYVPVPLDIDQELNKIGERASERAKVRLGDSFPDSDDTSALMSKWKPTFDLLRRFVAQVRGDEQEQLNRQIGTAQLIDVMVYVTTALVLGADESEVAQYTALDTALKTYIVPQLEGLRRDSLENFANWLKKQTAMLKQTYDGVEDLTRLGF